MQLGSGRTLYAHFVLDAAHYHSAVGFVEDEVGEASAVVGALFAACKNEVKVGIAIGDETLYAVEAPAFVGLVVGGLETHRLQVAAGIGFGEVHRAGSTFINARQIFVLKFFVCKLLYGVGTVLQAPDGGKTYVGTGYDFGCHNCGYAREIETVVLALEGHSVKPRLDKSVEVAACARSVVDVTVDERRANVVDLFCVGSDDFAGYFASFVQ